ncbi:hypothetical protein UCD39_21010 [Nitrospirillum sp. BR 11752]|uniref:plasmid mobilization protein n=1 Tax=Nitrospirillum sp. BR 11752 TaxID=3104293 RepID=UPI002EBD7681|nr:hypothetical protein [Nitrospirillum sp. BR 11752]
MGNMEGTQKLARRRQPQITVRPLPDERRQLQECAAVTGLPIAEFMLRAALGAQIRSVVDLDQVLILSKHAADNGRLGGLLKQLMARGEGVDFHQRRELRALLMEILKVQKLMEQAARAILSRV